jgi:hypothetical protein
MIMGLLWRAHTGSGRKKSFNIMELTKRELSESNSWFVWRSFSKSCEVFPFALRAILFVVDDGSARTDNELL